MTYLHNTTRQMFMIILPLLHVLSCYRSFSRLPMSHMLLWIAECYSHVVELSCVISHVSVCLIKSHISVMCELILVLLVYI